MIANFPYTTCYTSDAHHEKTDLKVCVMSYQKKDGRAWLDSTCVSFGKECMTMTTDLKVCFCVTRVL